MKKFLFLVVFASVVGWMVTFPIQSSFHSKAKLIQRVEKSSSADLFGDEGTPIGDPMELIIEDPKAFIGGPNEKGIYKVDEGYLKSHQIYPRQLKTVDFFAGIFRMGFFFVAIGASALAYLIGRRGKSQPLVRSEDL